ncbi:MAG: DUF1080 domain-containing protein [Chloroflexota bacterium]|nr:DUF1080 domain-containing protein [Chloroflexota bacterium]
MGLIISALIGGSGGVASAQSGPIVNDPLTDPSLSTSWPQGQGPDDTGVSVTGAYSDDGFHLGLSASGAFSVHNQHLDAALQAGGAFADQSIEVDARQVDGGGVNNSYGVVCRASTGAGAYYSLWVGSDGTAGIYKSVSVGTDRKPPVVLVHAEIPADTGYHLRADCTGNRLTLFVNGTKVAEAQDADVKSGGVGFFVSTNDAIGIDVAFTNLSISRA